MGFLRKSGGMAALLALPLAACSSEHQSLSAKSAEEQLLIAVASDRAAEALARALPDQGAVFIDPINFEGVEGKYAIGAIRESLARRGMRLASDRAQADRVIEVRTGAMAVEGSDLLFGVPGLSAPVPLAGALETPEVALFKKETMQGMTRLTAASFDRQSGALTGATGPRFGFSHKTKWTALLVFTWQSSDLLAKDWAGDAVESKSIVAPEIRLERTK
ncbi:hypothetical protein Rru_A0255 [Rhodospirillum rubrum ATCC 11170]|uniref:Lipoprotein n=2 Tax=Rhodospirillum rubrum TaxID=1085 RepID=Q2RXT5_RHORT|nr:hypothetical protein Rru_A0255 [Rhodospirillum rubrum ATCC 11170]MBK5952604.1 hypothetical protein [Rhodospirillum rubrum]HAP98944.1 hypothetical protein [Rhodospirillum rubrum]HCF17651.1 hypothetical protein [Rhodospirillum rubrum]